MVMRAEETGRRWIIAALAVVAPLGAPRVAAAQDRVAIHAISPAWVDLLVHLFTNPIVVPLLLSVGILGLLLELKAGAFGIGGLVSVASLGLFFGSAFMLGLAGWQELVMLGAGTIALAVELFVLPGFGVAGILGLALIGGSVVLAMLGATPTGGDVMIALGILGSSIAITAAVAFAWLRHLPNSTRWSGLLLRDSVHRGEGYLSAPAHDELVGKVGVALTDLRPSGTAEVEGERVDVVTEGGFVKAGAAITVLRAEGYRHVVRPAHPVESHTV